MFTKLKSILGNTIDVGVTPDGVVVKMVGLYFTTITTRVARIIVSFVGGFGLSYSLALFCIIFNINYIEGYWWLVAVTMSIIIGLKDPLVKIPADHVGIITFFGRRYQAYLLEGDYTWTGQRFFFGVSSQALPKAVNVLPGEGEEQGYVYIGKRITAIWDKPDAKGKNTSIMLQMKGASTVYTSLDVNTTILDPMKWARLSDAIRRLANTIRTSLRKVAGMILDTDFNVSKEIVTDLIEGKRVLVVFTRERIDSCLEGTMVKDPSGSPVYHKVDDNSALEPQITRFAKRVEEEGNEVQVNASRDKNGLPVVALLDVKEKLKDLLEEVGAVLDSLILSDAQLSDIVREAGEKAASEGLQRDAQIMSARTQQEVATILSTTEDGAVLDDFSRAIAASADGNSGVSVVLVPGADSLTRAAVAGGRQIRGNK